MRPVALLTLVTLAGAACRDAAEPIQPASAVTEARSGYEAIDLGTLGGGSTLPAALNNDGQVVGRSQVADGKYHAFLWREGAMHALAEPPGAITSGAEAINNNGLIAGTAEVSCEVSCIFENSVLVLVWENGVARELGAGDPALPYAQVIAMNELGDVLAIARYDEVYHDNSLLWLGGVMYDLGRLHTSVQQTWGRSLNDRGQVVGLGFHFSQGPADYYAPFLWENGTIRSLGLLGRTPPCGPPLLPDDQPCSDGAATDINQRGDVVGCSVDVAGVTRPFLWQDGVLRDLGALAGQSAVAVAINERGQVAGHDLHRGLSGGHGFLWQNGVTRDIGSLGAGGTRVIAMNNHGEIVGSSFTAAGRRHAFVWTSGSLIDLGAGSSEADESEAIAINARGDVLGVSRDCDPQCQFDNFGTRRAVLWRKTPY